MTKLLSVVVSVYNEELALREFYMETGKTLNAAGELGLRVFVRERRQQGSVLVDP